VVIVVASDVICYGVVVGRAKVDAVAVVAGSIAGNGVVV